MSESSHLVFLVYHVLTECIRENVLLCDVREIEKCYYLHVVLSIGL
jgi:hypothetical protein